MLRAANVIVVWRIRLLVSSFLTRNVGDEGPRTANSSTCGNLQVSVSTWYWQQGSNCQETVYNPQDMTAIKPSGPQMYGRSPQSIPVMIAVRPDNAAVLWRQFPTAIHLEVSSPNFDGSITIKLHSDSNALSSSYSNVSWAFSLSYTSLIMATLKDSSL